MEKNIPILNLQPEMNADMDNFMNAIKGVLQTQQFIMGEEVKAFETEAAKFLGVKHAIGVANGTDAIIIGLQASGVKRGDEVITTPFTFFATAEAIEQVGAIPVFVDIDPATFNIDPNLVEKAITPKTKAIVPVHLYGRAAPMNQLMAIAKKHNLVVVEDCAQSFGSLYHGGGEPKHTGSFGDAGAYSFFPSKNLGCFGDGGLVTTNDDKVADMAKMLRVHGAKKKYHNEILGYNSRLDTIQAAILRIKLRKIADKNEGRRQAAMRYDEMLGAIPGIVRPEISKGHVFHQYTVRVKNGKRDLLSTELEKRGISTFVYYPVTMDQLPLYKGKFAGGPLAHVAAGEVLSLPIWPEIDIETQQRVVKAIAEILK